MASADELSAQNRATPAWDHCSQSQNLKQTPDSDGGGPYVSLLRHHHHPPFCAASASVLLGRRYNVGALSNLDTCNII